MTFSEEFGKFDRAAAMALVGSTDTGRVMRALDMENPDFADFLALLSPAAEGALDAMAVRASEMTVRHFGKNISMYIPVYISNECVNACAYCGFHRDSGAARKTLTMDEISREAGYVASLGLKNILLLTGESRKAAPVDYVARAVSEARKKVPQVSLEIYPVEEKDYAALVSAGASGLTVYQETYDMKIYDAVHGKGPKKDFFHRLGTPERALAAGFRKAGIGALLGLADWRMEAAYIGLHARYLMKKYWKAEISVSFPRLRSSQAGFKPAVKVDDRDLVQMMLALRLFLPRAGLTVSTRESAEFRDNIIGLGVTSMSAGSSTVPGGYTPGHGDHATGQFEIVDNRSVSGVADAIRAKGFYPVFKDWDENFAGASYENKD